MLNFKTLIKKKFRSKTPAFRGCPQKRGIVMLYICCFLVIASLITHPTKQQIIFFLALFIVLKQFQEIIKIKK